MSKNRKCVLVTGGAGYAGSLLVRLLLNHDQRVVVVDKLNFGGESLLGIWQQPNFVFVKGDLTERNVVKDIFANYKIDSVVHLAAIVGDPACAKDPKLAQLVNWDVALNVLEQAIKHKVARFVFASTCSNYGKMADPTKYVDEQSILAPVSLYAELKVKFEQALLKEVEKKDWFAPTALRFATIYGVSPRMRFDLTVNEFTKELTLGRELEVFGEQFWRPYCQVSDFGRAVALVLASAQEKVAYDVFNVGDTKENYQKLMIINEIKKLIPGAKVKYVKKQEDPRDYRVSFEKIKTKLGFTVAHRLPEGIRDIKSLIDNKIIANPDDRKYCNC